MNEIISTSSDQTVKKQVGLSQFFKSGLKIFSAILFILALSLGIYAWWWKVSQPIVPEVKKTLTEAEQLDLLKKLQADGPANLLSPAESVKILTALQADAPTTPLSRDEQFKLLQALQNN